MRSGGMYYFQEREQTFVDLSLEVVFVWTVSTPMVALAVSALDVLRNIGLLLVFVNFLLLNYDQWLCGNSFISGNQL